MRACRIFKQYPTHGSSQLVIDKQRLMFVSQLFKRGRLDI